MTAGNAVHLAAIEVRDKAIKAAAELMEASAGDLELVDGAVRVKGVPQMNRSLGADRPSDRRRAGRAPS